MPYLNGCLDQDVEYESIVGCLQGIVDSNRGCNFVFGGDFNLSKHQVTINTYDMLSKFCIRNNIVWLDHSDDTVQYTFHADRMGHFSLIDQMLASECLVQGRQSVAIHVDDSNISDHYAISCPFDIGKTHGVHSNVSDKKDVKLMWDKADLDLYRLVLQQQLSQITLPVDALLCDSDMCCSHDILINEYYQDIVNCLTTASMQAVPSQKVGYQKFWWTEELDNLKAATIEATSVWRYAGCPRSGPVNDNRLQCKYKYKLAIKEAAAEANKSFNDDLYYKMCTKDDQAFWKSWRKKLCSHTVKCTNVLNGHYGDVNICNAFTVYFQSVYRPNTADADLHYERQVNNRLAQKAGDSSCAISVDINDVQRCIDKMKTKKAAGHDGIMAEHLKFGGPQLYVHVCLLFNSIIRHSYVPDAFGHGIIIPLLKDKHGDSSKLETYRGIALSALLNYLNLF